MRRYVGGRWVVGGGNIFARRVGGCVWELEKMGCEVRSGRCGVRWWELVGVCVGNNGIIFF